MRPPHGAAQDRHDAAAAVRHLRRSPSARRPAHAARTRMSSAGCASAASLLCAMHGLCSRTTASDVGRKQACYYDETIRFIGRDASASDATKGTRTTPARPRRLLPICHMREALRTRRVPRLMLLITTVASGGAMKHATRPRLSRLCAAVTLALPARRPASRLRSRSRRRKSTRRDHGHRLAHSAPDGYHDACAGHGGYAR